MSSNGEIPSSCKYGLDPPYLPHYCDGCNDTFYIYHVLDCKWGFLVTARHNELRDGVTGLSGKYLAPTHVCDDLLIFTGCVVKRPKETQDRSKATKSTSATPPLEATE